MKYEDLHIKLLRMMKPHWKRVVAFDLETYVTDGFLTNERILAASIARRVEGDFTKEEGIDIKTIILKEDSDESEVELLKEFGKELESIRPLCVVGYGIRQYDIPLMAIKKQHYGSSMKRCSEFWKIVDFVESAVHIDLYHILKYKGYRKFDEVVYSKEFANLPLKRTKNIVSRERSDKASEIYQLWKKDREKLKAYVEGDAHDALLIAEKLLMEELHGNDISGH